jgi:hypothetical protein
MKFRSEMKRLSWSPWLQVQQLANEVSIHCPMDVGSPFPKPNQAMPTFASFMISDYFALLHILAAPAFRYLKPFECQIWFN